MPDNPWVSAEVASRELCVSINTLRLWRERGYLKPGTHWRSSQELSNKPWTPEVIYHLRWCKEEIDHWLAKDAPINDIAA